MRACRSVDPSPRGRRSSRVAAWARVSSASSRWYSASSAISGARCSRTPRPRWRSSRGPNDRGLLDQVGLGLDDQVVTEVVGQRVQRLDDHPGLGQVQSPAPSASAVCVHRDPRDAANAACRRTVPWFSRVWCRQPGRGGPVTGLLGDVVRGSEDPQLLGHHACLDPRDPQQELLPLTGRTELRTDRRELVQPTLDRSRGCGVRAGHRTIQAPTTDSSSGLRTPCPQGVPRKLLCAPNSRSGPAQSLSDPVRPRGRSSHHARSAAQKPTTTAITRNLSMPPP